MPQVVKIFRQFYKLRGDKLQQHWINVIYSPCFIFLLALFFRYQKAQIKLRTCDGGDL